MLIIITFTNLHYHFFLKFSERQPHMGTERRVWERQWCLQLQGFLDQSSDSSGQSVLWIVLSNLLGHHNRCVWGQKWTQIPPSVVSNVGNTSDGLTHTWWSGCGQLGFRSRGSVAHKYTRANTQVQDHSRALVTQVPNLTAWLQRGKRHARTCQDWSAVQSPSITCHLSHCAS